MASYDASINVRVSGTSMVNGVINRVQELERLVRDINTRPLDLSRAFGRGDIADRFGVAARELNGLKNSFINTERAVEAFGTTTGRTVANTTALSRTFKQIADNSDIASAQFREFTVAAQQAAVAANTLGRARLSTLANEVSFGGRGGQTIGGGTLVQELLAQRTQIPNSIAALEAYQGELIDLQRIVRATSPEFRELEQAVYQLDVALGRAGQFGPAAPPVQGPALPPNFIPPTRPTGGRSGGGMPGASGPTSSVNPLQRAADMQENLMLGAGFPLLFGGGVGQVAGGLLGSFVGTGFGGQILGSAIGQQLEDAFKRITEIGKATEMLNMDRLRDSVIIVNAQLDYQVSLLKKAGKADEARALIAKAVFEQTGLTAGATERITNTSNLLGNAWDGVIGAVSGFLSLITSSLVPALLPALKLVELSFKAWNMIISAVQDVAAAAAKWVLELVFGKELAEKILNFFKGTNEESEKTRAALSRAADEQAKVTKRAEAALAIEKTRTNNVSLMGKLINIEADRREKINDANAAAEDKLKAARDEYKGDLSDFAKKELARLEQKIKGERNVAIELANILALRQRELAKNADLVEQDKVRIALLQMQGEIAKASEDANDKVRVGQIQELEQRKQIALTLNDELSAVNSIYNRKKQGIDAAYAAAKREADLKVQTAALDLASIKAQKARGLADDNQVAQAQNVYNTAVAVTQETLRGAQAVKSAATSAADLERRQQTVAAYTAQFASEASRATNALNQQAASISNQASLVQTLSQAYVTINGVKIQSLQNTLAETRDVSTRAIIIDKIKNLEIANARLVLRATLAQIDAEVARQRIAYLLVQVKYQELQATVAIAKAQGLMNRAYQDALDTQLSALNIARDAYKTAVLGAGAQRQAANAVFKGSVEAARLKANTEGAARAAGQFAGSMGTAADNMKAMTGMSYSRPGLEDWQERYIAKIVNAAGANKVGFTFGDRVTLESQLFKYFQQGRLQAQAASDTQQLQEFQAKYGAAPYGSGGSAFLQTAMANIGGFASGGYVTGPTLGLIGEGSQSEYIIPENKMALASANYLAGGRGAGIMEGGGGGGSAPSINITTGPVVEFNGERYVTMRDMERGLQQMATNIYSGLRTPSGRYATGVR